VVSAITYRNAVPQKRREKIGNARACGSQRRAAGVPQALLEP